MSTFPPITPGTTGRFGRRRPEGHRPPWMRAAFRALVGKPPAEPDDPDVLDARARALGSDLGARADDINQAQASGLLTETPGLEELNRTIDEGVRRRVGELADDVGRAVGGTRAAQDTVDAGEAAVEECDANVAAAAAEMTASRPPLGVFLTSGPVHALLMLGVFVPGEAWLTFPSLRVLMLPDNVTFAISLLIGAILALLVEAVAAPLYYAGDNVEGERSEQSSRGRYYLLSALALVGLVVAVWALHAQAVSRENNTQIVEEVQAQATAPDPSAGGFGGLPAPAAGGTGTAGSAGSGAAPAAGGSQTGGFGSGPAAGRSRTGGFGTGPAAGGSQPGGFGTAASDPAQTATSPAKPDLGFTFALQVGGLIAGLLLSLRFHMARQYRDGMRGLNRARRRARAARISLTFRRRRLARAAARQDGIERQVVGLVEAGRQRWLRLVDLVRVEMTESALEHDHDPFVMIVPEPEPTDDVVDTLLNPERPAATQPVVVPTVVEPAPVDDPADDPRPDGMGADDERTEADDDPAQSEAWAPPPPPPPPPHAAPPPPPRPPAEVAGLTVTDGDPLSEAELDEMPTAAWARPRDRVTVNGGPPPDIPRDRPRDRSAQGGPQ